MTQFSSRPTLEQTEIVRLLRGIKFELHGIRCELKRMNDLAHPDSKSKNDKDDKVEQEQIENENPS